MGKTNELKYFEDPKQNAAFLRCVDLLAGLIEKYADAVLVPDKEYQFDYSITIAGVTYLLEFMPEMSGFKRMELYSKKSGILHGSRLLNKKSAA